MKISFTSAIVSSVLLVAGLVDFGSAQGPSRLATCRCPAVGRPARSYNSPILIQAVNKGYGAPDYTIGDYPHTFGNIEQLPFLTCAGQTLKEFPVKTSGTFNGTAPGQDRVVYTTSGQFCGCMTHEGAIPSGRFVLCSFTL